MIRWYASPHRPYDRCWSPLEGLRSHPINASPAGGFVLTQAGVRPIQVRACLAYCGSSGQREAPFVLRGQNDRGGRACSSRSWRCKLQPHSRYI